MDLQYAFQTVRSLNDVKPSEACPWDKIKKISFIRDNHQAVKVNSEKTKTTMEMKFQKATWNILKLDRCLTTLLEHLQPKKVN